MRILQDVSVDGSLTGTSFIKTGGTSSQYLMADGSVGTIGSGGGNTIIGTDSDISYSGATVVSTINMTDGVITSHSSRTLTLANLGYTGATNANYITNNNQLSNGAGYITSAGNTNTQLSAEQVEDIMGAAWISGTNNTFVYDDAAGTLRINSLNTNTVYTHPTYAGDDMSIDTGALTGAVIVSDIDLNVTTDTLGHVTDTNATVATRTLTLANLGYTGATNANNYVHPSYASTNINTSGATIADIITTNSTGHVTALGTRVLTLAELGFTGATNANYITNNNQLTNGAGYVTLNTQLSTEAVQDIVGAMFINGTNTTAVYDDAGNTMKIDATGSASIWTADTYGATIATNVGIGTASNSSIDLYVDGSARFTGATRIDGELSPTTGLNLDGNAYLKDQNGTSGSTGDVLTKHALGGVEWAAASGGSGTVTNVTGGTGIDVTSGTTTPNVYLDLNELSAVYTTSGMKNTDAVAIIDSTTSRKVYVEDFRRYDTYPTASTGSGTIIKMTAASAITAGYAVASIGTMSVEHANANAGIGQTKQAIGIALNAASTNGAVDVLIHGVAYFTLFPTFTIGNQVYLDDLAGRLSSTVPFGVGDMVQVIGTCIASDKVLINPSVDYMIRS